MNVSPGQRTKIWFLQNRFLFYRTACHMVLAVNIGIDIFLQRHEPQDHVMPSKHDLHRPQKVEFNFFQWIPQHHGVGSFDDVCCYVVADIHTLASDNVAWKLCVPRSIKDVDMLLAATDVRLYEASDSIWRSRFSSR